MTHKEQEENDTADGLIANASARRGTRARGAANFTTSLASRRASTNRFNAQNKRRGGRWFDGFMQSMGLLGRALSPFTRWMNLLDSVWTHLLVARREIWENFRAQEHWYILPTLPCTTVLSLFHSELSLKYSSTQLWRLHLTRDTEFHLYDVIPTFTMQNTLLPIHVALKRLESVSNIAFDCFVDSKLYSKILTFQK